MDIKKTFVRLTNYTCPHGQEEQYIRFLPKEVKMDEFGNYYMHIGDNSKTIFACHLDTVSSKRLKVKHVYDGKFIKTDGKTILGADDKAGLTILLYMIHKKIPGLYYFFIGEEVGCVGSRKASKKVEFFKNYRRIISFDRRDTHSVITFQSSQRCCSDDFADGLAKQLNKYGMNMRKDDTGVYTDSAEFTSVIPECTNISVGYYSEHSGSERQDIEHLKNLSDAVVQVNWEALPTRRDPSKTEHKSYGGYGGYGGYTGYEDGGFEGSDFYWGGRLNKKNSRHNVRPRWDNEEGYEDYYNPMRDSNMLLDGNHPGDEDDDYVYPSMNKKTNRTENIEDIPSREFFDSGSGLEELSDTNRIKWFTNIKDRYLDDRITDAEIEILKEQILDMKDPSDAAFLKELESLRSVKNHGYC